jgi:diamine N-acetyltransferase
MTIQYEVNGEEGLSQIGPLWERLTEHQGEISTYFGDYFKLRSFNERKTEILERSKSGSLRVELARDLDYGQIVGYCVSTITKDKLGHIESIYIEPHYRRTGIGKNLMRRAVSWMDESQVTKKILYVVVGNEQVFPFYNHYGFYPKAMLLEQV